MERIDDTGFNGIRVIQSKGDGYGVDAVLLAAFAAGETGARGLAGRCEDPAACEKQKRLRIADLGTGCGAVAFILHHKLGGARITGFDIRKEAADRAAKACEMNGLSSDIDFICADINDLCISERGHSQEIGQFEYGREAGAFDAVVTNPPYFRRTPNEPGAQDPDGRYIARHETTAELADFAKAAASLLKDGGSLYMVHRPDRLADIMTDLRAAGIEPKEMQMVVPCAGRAANIVLIHGIRGAGAELRVLPDIAVRTPAGAYTGELLQYYERKYE